MTSEHDGEQSEEGVRVTDRRRIDPDTGEVRAPAGAAGDPADASATVDAEATAEADVASAEAAAANERVAELTADLQRIAAEYKNYRDRVQREIADARVRGRVDVVTELIPTFDDLDRAAEHGDLTGPVKALADNLDAALTRAGVQRYGSADEVFDPEIHEALTHSTGEGFEQPTVTTVYQPGYRLGDRIIRPARVAVTE